MLSPCPVVSIAPLRLVGTAPCRALMPRLSACLQCPHPLFL